MTAAANAAVGKVVIQFGMACGNGIVEGSEICDDGNANNTDACSNTCTKPAKLYGPNHTFAGQTASYYVSTGQGGCSVGTAAGDAAYFCTHFYGATCTPVAGYSQTTFTGAVWKMHKNGGCTANGADIPGLTCDSGPCKIGNWVENLSGLTGLVCSCP